MKNLVLSMTILFFLSSCSNDEDLSSLETNIQPKLSAPGKDIPAQNIYNPFDSVGAAFYLELTGYIAQNGFATSREEVTDQLIYLTQKKAVTSKSLITVTPEMIAIILANPETKLLELIDNSSLSIPAKNSLTVFVGNLIERQQGDYDQVHCYIVDYEENIIVDNTIVEDEKETILKFSSISRYSLYAEARKRDRDWETSVTNKSSNSESADTEMTITTLAVLFKTLY